MKYKNSVKIHEKSVSKKRNDKVLELYNYLDTSNFNNYPKVIDVTEEEMESEYISETPYHEITECTELIKTMATLHSKTLYLKSISNNKYRDIRDKIQNNIDYLKEYYEEIIDSIESEIYMSPSHYLFARNYSVILGSLKYCENELKKYYSLVKEKDTERVSIIHNNISNDHFIKGDKNYLISWDKYLVDTPVLDLYKFYKKDGYKKNFKALLDEYNKILPLSKEETILLKVLISIPPKIKFIDFEIDNVNYIKDNLVYIYNTYNVIK